MKKTLLSAAAICAVFSAPAFAQNSDPLSGMSADVARQIDVISNDKRQYSAAQKKIDSALIYSAREANGQAQFPDAPGLRLPQLSARDRIDTSGQVLVDIKTTDADATAEQVRFIGGTVVSAFQKYNAVRANVPIVAVEAIATIPAVTSIRKASLGYSNRIDPPPSLERRLENVREQLSKALGDTGNVGKGPTISQSVVAHGADILQNNSGLTGAGSRSKICVMSDGVNSLAARQSAGELPAVQILNTQGGNGDEGTAMLELVADMAPGATLGFATALGGKANMAANIYALTTTLSCNIIVDDWTYFDEAAFQEDVVANEVTYVSNPSNGNVAYFSSAGNSGRLTGGNSGTWEGDFVNGGGGPASIGGSIVHSFGANNYNTLTARGQAVTLHWSDPFGGSINDYDLYITNSTGTTLLASSHTSQDGAQDPYEYIDCNSTVCPVGARIYIKDFAALAPRAIRLDAHRGRLSVSTSGSVFGHNGGINVISVAAVPTPNRKFNSSDQVEDYSSDGLRRLFLNPVPSTTPITTNCYRYACGGGTTYQKPDIAASDCVTTTTPGFIPFCGTSAAAPNAAAIAAHLKARAPVMTKAQILSRMQSTAIDIMAAGADRDSGSGIVMADAAVLGGAPARPHDFNHDFRGDILWRSNTGDLVAWLMNGAALTANASLGNVALSWTVVGQRDFNGDGNVDLLWAGPSGQLAIWFMNGTSVSSVANLGSIGPTWSVVGTGDFNGDNKGDILWRNSSGDLAIWFMNGASASQVASLGNVATNWSVAATADFDGNGRSDILWRSSGGDNAIWFMNGSAISSVASLSNVPVNWAVAGTGDFNGFGRGNILWRNTSGDIAMWIMNGATITQNANLGNVPTNWSVVAIGDYNGNVNFDILWRNTSGDTAIWFMNGATVSSNTSLGNIAPNWTVQSANAN